jgi:filamentous hemagglutinin family protein
MRHPFKFGFAHPGLACTLSITGAIALIGTAPALAQITPDTTLGAESSIVTPDAIVGGNPADLIEGGALRGSNVFHSFIDFNVAESQRVYFANPNGINNIVSRVTGGNVSNIFGTLGVDGAANLFLLNPNGILFGPNAQLDVAGSFSASTGDRFSYLDGSEFNAINPNDAPLVTVNITPGAQLVDVPQGDILNAADLEVGAGQTLALLGDTVINSGEVTAAGGTVQVLGNQVNLIDQATINVSGDTGGGNVFIGGEYLGQGSLPTAQHTVVEAGVTIQADALTQGDGGTVIVWADDATEFAGQISARGGLLSGNGGFVETSGAQSLSVAPTARVDTTAAHGQGGLWLLDPADLTVQSGGTATIAGGTNSPATDTTISAATIVTALDTTAVLLLATNSITVDEVIDASGNATANTLTFDAPTLTLNQNVLTEGGQVYDGNVVVGGANIALTSDAGAIAFNGAINAATAGTQGLTVNGNTGVTLGDGLGADEIGTTALASLAVTGATTINSSTITTTGNQTFNSDVTLQQDVTLSNNGGAIAFNGPVNSDATARSLAINTAPGGSTTFNSNVGNGQALAALAITGTTVLNAAQLTTTGTQTYTGAVTVDAAATTLVGSAVTFTDTVNSAAGENNDLTVNTAGGGTTNFSGIVGGSDALASLVTNADGTTVFNTSSVTTTGNQTYNDAVRLNQNLTLTSNNGTLQFNSTVDSAPGLNRTLTLDADTDVVLAGVVGGGVNSALGDLTVTAGDDTQINAAVTVNGDLAIAAADDITAGNNLLTVAGDASFATTNNNGDISANGLAVAGTVAATTTGNSSDATFGTLANPTNALVLATSSVNGTLNVVSAGTITQAIGSTLTTTGNASFRTTLANTGDVALRNDNPNFVLRPSDVGGNLTLIGNNSTLTQAGGGTGLRVAGNLTLNGIDNFSGLSNGVFGLSAIDAAGNVIISQPGTVNVSNAVQLLTGNTTVGGDLTVQATTQGFASNFSGTPAITLNQSGNSFGGSVSVNTPMPPLGPALTPAIVQATGVTVLGNTTLNANTGDITLLSGGNRFAGELSLSGNNASIGGTTADLTLNTVNLTGNLSLTTLGGDITDTGPVTVAGATSLISTELCFFPGFCVIPPGDVILDDPANQLGTLTVRGVGVTIVENDDIDVASIQASAFGPTFSPLTLTSTGNITQTGSIRTGVTGATTLTATGDITLTNGANRLGTLALTATNANLVDTTPVTFDTSNLTGDLVVQAGGAIDQVGALTVTGATTLTGVLNQPITLDNTGNSFGGLITLAPVGVGSVALADTSNNTQLAGFASNGNVTVTNLNTNGAIDLTGAIAAGGSLTFTANDMDLNGNPLSASTNPFFGRIRLQPLDDARDITLGGTIANTLDLTVTDLANIGPTGLIILGRDTGTGAVTIANPVSFNSDVLIQGGSITANGGITNNGNDVTLLARGGDIDTAGQTLTTTGNGGANGGNVRLQAIGGAVTFGNILTQAFGGGNGGNVFIEGDQVSATNVTVDPYNGGSGAGNTGNTTLRAVGLGGDVTLSGTTLFGDSYGSGSGGRVQLISEQGNVVLTANTVIRNDNFSSGLGGDVVINAAQGLTLIDSEIRTNGQSSGFAGNITLQAPNVTLNNSIISAETQNNAPAGGSFVTPLGQLGFLVAGANINISGTGAGILRMQDNSLITARGRGWATPGGNIRIQGFSQVVALPANPGGANPGNDIITTAEGPLGGVIDLQLALLQNFTTSQISPIDDAVFNQLRMNGVNDIVSSGTVSFLDFTVLDDSQEVDVGFVDVSSLVGTACNQSSDVSTFRVNGRGGIPANPMEPLTPVTEQLDWIFLDETGEVEDEGIVPIYSTAPLLALTGECYFPNASQSVSVRR